MIVDKNKKIFSAGHNKQGACGVGPF